MTLFGDTPADMIGAIENGIRAVGVATGSVSVRVGEVSQGRGISAPHGMEE